MNRNYRAIFVVAVLLLITARPAWCYFDPGTGSMLFQSAVAGVFGGLFLFRKTLGNVGRFLRKLFRNDRA